MGPTGPVRYNSTPTYQPPGSGWGTLLNPLGLGSYYQPAQPTAQGISSQQAAAVPALADNLPAFMGTPARFSGYGTLADAMAQTGGTGSISMAMDDDPAPRQSTDDDISFWEDLYGTNPANNNPANSNPANPNIIYQQQYGSPQTLHDYGQQIGGGLNNWLMSSYLNAPSRIANETNDAWAQQSNINARNAMQSQLINAITGAMNGFGNNGGNGYHDTASRQRAGGGSYTTSIDAGGMDPAQSAAAVTAMQNAHPGTNGQHGDLRRAAASTSANEMNRYLQQNYAGTQGRMEPTRAGEGQGLANYSANQDTRNRGYQTQLQNVLLNSYQRQR